MSREFLAAAVLFGFAVAADEYYNFGFYTDAALTVLWQVGHSFGW